MIPNFTSVSTLPNFMKLGHSKSRKLANGIYCLALVPVKE